MLQPFQHTVLFSRQSLRLALAQAGYVGAQLGPARKVLTLDYLVEQIRIHNRSLAGLYRLASPLLPRRVREAPLGLNIGEMMAVARTTRRQVRQTTAGVHRSP
jgi:uncharacterized protein (DUF2236 family)